MVRDTLALAGCWRFAFAVLLLGFVFKRLVLFINMRHIIRYWHKSWMVMRKDLPATGKNASIIERTCRDGYVLMVKRLIEKRSTANIAKVAFCDV